jgi:hypothetical protein
MPIQTLEFISRAFARAHPNDLFVFGDNLARNGFGGQAREMRGEPNAIGLPTKRLPSMRPEAFLSDADLSEITRVIAVDCLRLMDQLKHGGVVFMSSHGIGTGRARLAEKAPKIFIYYDDFFETLRKIAKQAAPPS